VTSVERATTPHVHAWRDIPPAAGDGRVNAYIEIPRGELRKWEFDQALNDRRLDRVMPAAVGGYPVNYGFVPQTVSYDGDPLDVLVLGPPLQGGAVLQGIVVALFLMDDEKGADAKIVLSPSGRDGKPSFNLVHDDRERIAAFFARYKRHEPGKTSVVRGWGAAADARALLDTTHAFFRECRMSPARPCLIAAR
jgi:inorganic pyrophosphatase